MVNSAQSLLTQPLAAAAHSPHLSSRHSDTGCCSLSLPSLLPPPHGHRSTTLLPISYCFIYIFLHSHYWFSVHLTPHRLIQRDVVYFVPQRIAGCLQCISLLPIHAISSIHMALKTVTLPHPEKQRYAVIKGLRFLNTLLIFVAIMIT